MTSQWPEEIEAVYLVCSPEKEKARYDRLVSHHLEVGVPAERLRIAAPTWGSTLTPQQIFSVYDPYLKRGDLPTFSFKASSLTKAEISLALNFYSAIQGAAAKGSGPILTFESDTYLRKDFVPRLRDLLTDLSGRPWDFVSLGEGVGTRPPECDGTSYYSPTKAYEPPHQWVFRCTDSMMFNTDFIQRLDKTFIPFKEIIDWEMNFQLMLNKGTPLWADPPLAEQGTWYARTGCSLY